MYAYICAYKAEISIQNDIFSNKDNTEAAAIL